MKRREFITLLGVAVAAWPLAASAQQTAMPVLGFLSSLSLAATERWVAAFRQTLKDIGYVEGQSLAIEYHWAEGRYDRLPALAADLVRRQVTVIAAFGPLAALAAKEATSNIPVVFLTGFDPVKIGLVASFNRPGGNLTGVILYTGALAAKRIELLREFVPGATVLGMLVNPDGPDTDVQVRDAQEAARISRIEHHIVNVRTEKDFETAFAALMEARVAALIVSSDPVFANRREQVVALAARHAVPAMYEAREFTASGGLMNYGTNVADAYRQAAVYAGHILKGTKPADLPIVQPTKFELLINLKTAKALGLTVPPLLFALADEVIE
jgi:putative tryptophan/tyrosine transport system substrate-binding protein